MKIVETWIKNVFPRNRRKTLFVLLMGLSMAFVIVSCSQNEAETMVTESGGADEQQNINTDDTLETSNTVVGYLVETGSLANALEVSGTVSGVQEALVMSQTQGIVSEVLVDLGDRVQAGDVLLRFDDSVEAAALRQARASLDSARLEADGAALQLDRGSGSRSQYVRAQATAAAAEAALEQARRNYENRTIRAPIDGWVADITAGTAAGNLLSIGSRTVRIVDTSRLIMRVGVGQDSIARIQQGSPVQVFIPSVRDAAFSAEVRSVSPAADPATGTFPLVIEWENTEDRIIRAGLAGIAYIESFSLGSSIIIPAAAVSSRAGETVVFVAEDGRAVQRPIVLAGKRGARAAVSEGLQEGEVVVVTGLGNLEDGDPISVQLRGSSRDIQ